MKGKIIVYACFGGFSNTGITTAIASMEAVKQEGADKVSIGCLAAVPNEIESVKEKNDASVKIITVDGCSAECARKILEKAGYKVESIVLTRDIGMKKKSLYEENKLEGVVDKNDIERAKEIIIRKIKEE
ncbi:MAG: putative zinc-binding protein [Candidatus Thermoplasmatota archaeon]